MEISMSTITSLFLALMVVVPALSLPLEVGEAESQNQQIEKRPKYMDTRDLDVFESYIWRVLQKFAMQGKLNPAVLNLSDAEEENDAVSNDTGKIDMNKRRRHLSFCLRRTGRQFTPYPCYRSSGGSRPYYRRFRNRSSFAKE